MKSISRRTLIAITTGLLLVPAAGFAAKGLPKGAKPADGKAVIQHYAGKSIRWKETTSPLGGAYYGPDGTMLTLYQDPKDKSFAVGIGKWTVSTKGTQCYTVTWNFKRDGEIQSKQGEQRCREHRQTADGELYALDTKPKRYNEWWRLKGSGDDSEASRTKNGNQFKAVMRREARKLGIKLP